MRPPAGAAMKRYFAFGVVMWLLCGFVGAWALQGDDFHLKTVAWGPIALASAFNQKPTDDLWPY